MKIIPKIKLIVLLLLVFCVSTACRNSAAQPGHTAKNPKGKPAEIQALLDKTMQNIVFVEGGSFMMGDQKHEILDTDGRRFQGYFTFYKDNKPTHKVTLDSFHIGKYEITYEEYDVFTEATGQEPTLKDFIGAFPWREGDYPAGVSWKGAKAYCQWLGEVSGLPFDLPTEAQWEYAARSRGQMVGFATDNGEVERGRNYPNPTRAPIPTGSFPPNPLGLHDMSGNVIEWVNDWYDPEYYQNSPEHNPRGPEQGEMKVRRGGGHLTSPGDSSVYARAEMPYLDKAFISTGFRCVLNQPEPLPQQALQSN